MNTISYHLFTRREQYIYTLKRSESLKSYINKQLSTPLEKIANGKETEMGRKLSAFLFLANVKTCQHMT
jgi:hypothetical protein